LRNSRLRRYEYHVDHVAGTIAGAGAAGRLAAIQWVAAYADSRRALTGSRSPGSVRLWQLPLPEKETPKKP
jgi:hypothetical protein